MQERQNRNTRWKTGDSFLMREGLAKVFSKGREIIDENGLAKFAISVYQDGDVRQMEITKSYNKKVKLFVELKMKDGAVCASLVDENGELFENQENLNIMNLNFVLRKLNAVSLLSVVPAKPTHAPIAPIISVETKAEAPDIDFLQFEKPLVPIRHDSCLYKYFEKDPTFSKLIDFCIARTHALDKALKEPIPEKFKTEESIARYRLRLYRAANNRFSTSKLAELVAKEAEIEKPDRTFIYYLFLRLKMLAIFPKNYQGEKDLKKIDWGIVLLAFLRDFNKFF